MYDYNNNSNKKQRLKSKQQIQHWKMTLPNAGNNTDNIQITVSVFSLGLWDLFIPQTPVFWLLRSWAAVSLHTCHLTSISSLVSHLRSLLCPVFWTHKHIWFGALPHPCLLNSCAFLGSIANLLASQWQTICELLDICSVK